MLNDNFFEVEEHSNASEIIDAEDSMSNISVNSITSSTRTTLSTSSFSLTLFNGGIYKNLSIQS